MKRVIFRTFLIAGAILYLRTLALNVVGEWALRHPTLENLKWGLRWDPGNPALWTRYGETMLASPAGDGERSAAEAFEKAALLNPFDPENWEGLANAYQQMLEPAKAEAALRAWLVAVPHSPQGAWRLGNFLLLQGRTQEASHYLKTAATSDPQLCMPLFDLAWKAFDDPETISRDLIPDNPASREQYLQFLIDRRNFTAAADAWTSVRAMHGEHSFTLGVAYLNLLVSAGKGKEAAKLWQELLADSGRAAAKPASEYLTNGDFEAGLPNVGLDWQFDPGTGYRVALDNVTAQSGTHSLQVNFDGSSNPDFSFHQTVPIEPGRDYHFRVSIKTEDITTDNGVRFEISGKGSAPGEQFDLFTDNLVGTNDWKAYELDLHTGPTTEFVWVSLRRFRSTKFNNLIQGKVWIDNVSLKPHR